MYCEICGCRIDEGDWEGCSGKCSQCRGKGEANGEH